MDMIIDYVKSWLMGKEFTKYQFVLFSRSKFWKHRWSHTVGRHKHDPTFKLSPIDKLINHNGRTDLFLYLWQECLVYLLRNENDSGQKKDKRKLKSRRAQQLLFSVTTRPGRTSRRMFNFKNFHICYCEKRFAKHVQNILATAEDSLN